MTAPTPYYASDRATLYVGDCRDVLASLPSLDARLMATDPPYGVGWRSGYRGQPFEEMAGDDGSVDWPAVLGDIVARHLDKRQHVYVFGYRPDQLAGPLRLGGTAQLIWDKGQAGPGDLSTSWGPSHEVITFGVHTPSPSERSAGRGALAARLRQGSVLREPSRRGRHTNRHPSEKPVRLMRMLIESSSLLGDLVLDPCAGSGSTAVAALVEGRRFVGVELDERYAATAVDRILAAEKIAVEVDAL